VADTVPGSAYVVSPAFHTGSEVTPFAFDRVRIRQVFWNYVDDTLNVQLDWGRDDPLSPGTNEWIVKTQVFPILDVVTADTVVINGVSFSRLVGTHYTTLKASLGTATETTQENLEDDIFAALDASGYFPSGTES